MQTTIEFNIEDKATPFLAKLLDRLGDAGRRKLEEQAAGRIVAAIRSHLFDLGNRRHATADSLGARPTNIIGRTAEGVSQRVGPDGVEVVIPHPLFRRAFRDVEIAPRNAKALAIPMSAAAYDKAPRSFSDLFVWKRKKGADGAADTGNAFLARKNGDTLQLLYLLYKGRITQQQDRSLLPDDATLAAEGKKGISDYIADILKRRAS